MGGSTLAWLLGISQHYGVIICVQLLALHRTYVFPDRRYGVDSWRGFNLMSLGFQY